MRQSSIRSIRIILNKQSYNIVDVYAKDTSKKVQAIKRVRGIAGKHLTKSPYGFQQQKEMDCGRSRRRCGKADF